MLSGRSIRSRPAQKWSSCYECASEPGYENILGCLREHQLLFLQAPALSITGTNVTGDFATSGGDLLVHVVGPVRINNAVVSGNVAGLKG